MLFLTTELSQGQQAWISWLWRQPARGARAINSSHSEDHTEQPAEPVQRAQRLFSAPMSSSSPVCKITTVHTCDPRSGEVEAGGSWIWSHKNKIKWPILYTAASGVTHWHLSSSAPPFHLEQQSTVQETRDGSVQKRTRIQFLAPMQRLTTTCNSVPGDPAPSEDLPGLLHTQVYT